MPTTPRKTAAAVRKPAAKKPAEVTGVSFEAALDRTTPGAFRFTEDEPKNGAEPVSGSIYLRKAHLNGVEPKRVRVTVEFL